MQPDSVTSGGPRRYSNGGRCHARSRRCHDWSQRFDLRNSAPRSSAGRRTQGASDDQQIGSRRPRARARDPRRSRQVQCRASVARRDGAGLRQPPADADARSFGIGRHQLGLQRREERLHRLSPRRRLRCGNRQRLVPDRGHGDLPVLDGDAGQHRRRAFRKPDPARCRRPPEGAPQADRRPARDPALEHPARKHETAGRRGSHGDARHARVLPHPALDPGPDRLRRRPDLRPPRHRTQVVQALGRCGMTPPPKSNREATGRLPDREQQPLPLRGRKQYNQTRGKQSRFLETWEDTEMRRLIWGFTLLVAAWPAAAAPDDKSDDKPSPAEQVKTLMADYQNGQQEYYAAVGKAKTAAEQTKALEKRPDPEALAAKLLELSEQNPDDEGVTPVALVNVMTLPLRGGEGTKLRQQALEKLTNEHSASDQLEPILLRFTYEPSPAAAAFLRAVADKNPKDALKGKATYGLGAMLQRASGYARQMHQKPDLEERIEVAFGKEAAQWLRDVDADGLGKEAEELFE